MRNLKRVLSLALACVMVIGMMVMTTGAADFTDADEIKYAEAVEVANALGIIEGYNGIFNPEGELYRDQGAKFIAYLMLGAEKAEMLKGTGKFTDVTWAAGFVEYCFNTGICTGYTDTLFGAADPLSGWAFGKWLLVAMGNDADECGYNGPNYIFDITVDMMENGLVLPGMDVTETLTREQAAQMLLIALQSGGSTTRYYYVVDAGTTVNTRIAANTHGTFTDITDAYVMANVIGNTVEVIYDDITTGAMIEELYGVTYDDSDVDEYGRPGVSYKNGKTGADKLEMFFANEAVATFDSYLGTNNPNGAKTVKAALEGYKLTAGANGVKVTDKNETGNAVGYNAINVYTDGVKANNFSVANTKTGVDAIAALTAGNTVVEIYANPTTKVITDIVLVNTFAASVAAVNPANAQTETPATITLANVNDLTAIETDKFAQGDVVLYTKVKSTTPNKYDVVTIEVADSFTGTLTSYTKDGEFTINGDVYEVSFISGCLTAANTVKGYIGVEKVYHLDANGDIIAVTAPEGAAPVVITDYAIVTDVAVKSTKDNFNTLTGVSVQVKVILDDGTTATYDLPLTKTNAGVYEFRLGSTLPTSNADWSFAQGDLGNETTKANALKNSLNSVYTYTVADGEITLAAAVDALGTNVAGTVKKDAVEVYTNGVKIEDSVLAYTEGGKTIIMNEETVFILKNANNQIVVKTGLAALENTEIAISGAKVIVDAKYAKVGQNESYTYVASVVFAQGTTFSASGATLATDLVYVDGDYTVSKNAQGQTICTYTAYKADGTTIALTGTADLPAGVYKYKSDNTINGSALGTNDKVYAAQTVGTIAGSSYELGTNNFETVTDSVKVVVVAANAALEKGATVTFIENAQNAVAVIFVTAAAPQQ